MESRVSRQPDVSGSLPGLVPCYWGSVNQWECDENDHLNVRFYAQKTYQAIQILLSRTHELDPDSLSSRVRAQHIRFLRECRAATPLRADCAVVHHDESCLTVVSIMHDNVAGTAVAGFVTDVDISGLALQATADVIPIPEQAQPRGIDPDMLTPPPADLAEACDAGYQIVGRGVVSREECDDAGNLLPHAYIGRISDGMPNLWAHLNPPGAQSAHSSGEQGGAALEQRLQIIAPLRQGVVFRQLSGVRALGNKTQQMSHLIFDESHGRVAATMEAVGVAMDLTTRKAVPIAPERRRYLEGLLLNTG